MMLKDDLEKRPGRWREGPVYVHDDRRGELVYEGAPASEVPALMRELTAVLRQGDAPPLVAGAMAHLDLVMIHPFKDGNGRMASPADARARAGGDPRSALLLHRGVPRAQHRRLLRRPREGRRRTLRPDPTRDERDWLRFCLTAHWRQAQTLLRRARVTEALWDVLEGDLDRLGLPARALPALAEAARGLPVHRAAYATLADVQTSR